MIFTFLMFIWKIAFPKTRLFAQVCLSEEASKRLALRTLYHEVPGSNAARGGIQFMTVMALHCTELVIIILPLSRYDLNSRPRWLSWMRRPTGDQEVAGSTPTEVGNILSWKLIMKYFRLSFSPFRWFKKGSCQFLAKECAQYWLTA